MTKHDLKLRLKLMSSYLGAQNGALAGPQETPDWSLHPDLGILPEKLKPPDYKREVNKKEGPTWRFPLTRFCLPFLILREKESQIPVSNKTAYSISSQLPGHLSLTYPVSNGQTQSSSDPGFSENVAGLRMHPCVQKKQQYLII
jgi:hypothetical protein